MELFSHEGLSEKEVRSFRAEAHQRLTWPLQALSLSLFAIAMLFSSEFNRRGQMRRIVIASAGMVLLVLLYFALRSLAVSHGWIAFGLYVLTLSTCALSVRSLIGGRSVARYSQLPHAMAGGR
jgi:lipopolysaccharide export system permease protein